VQVPVPMQGQVQVQVQHMKATRHMPQAVNVLFCSRSGCKSLVESYGHLFWKYLA
jgi:hypothetical protein